MTKKKYPEKLFYKIGEVCKITETQPYVLRFWESEFPQLAPQKNRAGQRVYRKDDIELIFKIKNLLYDEEYTIAGARKKLGMEDVEETHEEEMKQEEIVFEGKNPSKKPDVKKEEASSREKGGKGQERPHEAKGKLEKLEGQLKALLHLLDETDRKIKTIETKLKKNASPE